MNTCKDSRLVTCLLLGYGSVEPATKYNYRVTGVRIDTGSVEVLHRCNSQEEMHRVWDSMYSKYLNAKGNDQAVYSSIDCEPNL